MNVYVNGLLWIIGAACIGALIAFVARYFGLDEGRPENNEATGQVFVIVAGLHAVVVGFVLITLSESVNSARDDAFAEAEGLVAVSWSADALGDPMAPEVHRLGDAYATTVVQQEWPRMRDGVDVAGPGWQQLDQLRGAVERMNSEGDWAQDQKGAANDKLEEVYQHRHDRLDGAYGRGVVAVVWFVLVVGTLATVLLPNLFGGTTVASHVIVVSTLAGSLALVLFAIYQMQNPFSGGSKIGPDAFVWALDRLAR